MYSSPPARLQQNVYQSHIEPLSRESQSTFIFEINESGGIRTYGKLDTLL